MKVRPSIYTTSLSAFLNLILVYAVYAVCRVAYGLENWSVLGGNFFSDGMWDIWKGGFLFDTSAILYTNSLYMVLMLLPLHLKEWKGWQKVAKCVFVLVNTFPRFPSLLNSLKIVAVVRLPVYLK